MAKVAPKTELLERIRAKLRRHPSPTELVVDFLGGESVLGRPVANTLDLAEVVRAGIPTKAVQLAWDEGLITPGETFHLVVKRRTFDHRKKAAKKKLSAEESDRLARVMRVTAVATTAFGDPDKAAVWLRRPTKPLAGKAPIDLLDSDAGARTVEDLLIRIEHGLAA